MTLETKALVERLEATANCADDHDADLFREAAAALVEKEGEKQSLEAQIEKLGDLLTARIRELEGAWDWLAKNLNFELDWDEVAEGEAAWRVHRTSGNRNDREWTLISTGQTPLEAVQAARSVLNPREGEK